MKKLLYILISICVVCLSCDDEKDPPEKPGKEEPGGNEGDGNGEEPEEPTEEEIFILECEKAMSLDGEYTGTYKNQEYTFQVTYTGDNLIDITWLDKSGSTNAGSGHIMPSLPYNLKYCNVEIKYNFKDELYYINSEPTCNDCNKIIFQDKEYQNTHLYAMNVYQSEDDSNIYIFTSGNSCKNGIGLFPDNKQEVKIDFKLN